jgi:hypothetical protein
MYEYDEMSYFDCRAKPAFTSFRFHRRREIYGPVRRLGAGLSGNSRTAKEEDAWRVKQLNHR